jgi:hypothetical protein
MPVARNTIAANDPAMRGRELLLVVRLDPALVGVATGGSVASLAALGFAAVGAVVGWLVARAMATVEDDQAPRA